MDLVTHIQILEEAVCISLYTNALGKDMTPFVLLIAMNKYFGNQSWRNKTWNSNQLYFTYKLTLCHILPVWKVWANIFICFATTFMRLLSREQISNSLSTLGKGDSWNVEAGLQQLNNELRCLRVLVLHE